MPVTRVSLLLAVSALAQPAQGGDFFDQFWPETDIYVSLGENTRLFGLLAGTRTKADGYTDGQVGIHIDWFTPPLFNQKRMERRADIAKNRFVQLRLGYLYGRTPANSPNPFVEQTGVAEFTPRFFLPGKVLATDRNRGDFRFLNGVFTPRYRNRLKLERTFPLGRFNITPYISAEAFYNWRYNAFNRVRYSVGEELELTRRIVLETYYLRQQDSKSDPKGENVVGLALQLYFR
jgi:hypothetical protein